jgi:hypothetical protein
VEVTGNWWGWSLFSRGDKNQPGQCRSFANGVELRFRDTPVRGIAADSGAESPGLD